MEFPGTQHALHCRANPWGNEGPRNVLWTLKDEGEAMYAFAFGKGDGDAPDETLIVEISDIAKINPQVADERGVGWIGMQDVEKVRNSVLQLFPEVLFVELECDRQLREQCLQEVASERRDCPRASLESFQVVCCNKLYYMLQKLQRHACHEDYDAELA